MVTGGVMGVRQYTGLPGYAYRGYTGTQQHSRWDLVYQYTMTSGPGHAEDDVCN